MNELKKEVSEEIVVRELTINELESVNGGYCGKDLICDIEERFFSLN